MQQATARAWKPDQTAATELWFVFFTFFSTPRLYFILKVAHHIESYLGRAQSLFAFRTATPSPAIWIKIEERGEEAGMILGRRGVNIQTEKRSSIQSGRENLSNKSIKV